MITRVDAEQRIASWLEATPDADARRVLADTLELTRHAPQARGLRSRLRFAAMVPVAAAAAFAIIGLLVGVGFPRTAVAPVSGNGSILDTSLFDSNDVAVRVRHAPGDTGTYYLRAVAFDDIDTVGYRIGSSRTAVRPAGTDVLQGTADGIQRDDLRRVTLTILPGAFTSPIVLSPATPVLVDRGVRLTTVGQDAHFAELERDGGGPYTVTALLPPVGVPILRAPDPSYPADIVSTYTALPPQAVGPHVAALRDEVVRTAASAGPYDLANRIVEILRSSAFTYDTIVRDVDCSLSVAECFATSRRGYCVQYATTMAVILRDLGIPARIVEGFLPGRRDTASNTEVILSRDAHAWVEVYFSGVGWVGFDPTAGVGSAERSAVPAPTPP
jgi:transglutaminase-like putative cysteine protease